MGVLAGLRRAIAALALLACGMVLAVLALAVYSAIRTNAAAVERSTRLDPATAATARLLTQIVDQRSSLGAFLFTGDYDKLETYYRAEWEVPDRLGHLETLLADFDGPARTLREVNMAYQTWVTRVVKPELAAKARGDNDRIQEIERLSGAENMFDDLRGLLTTLDERITDEQKEAFERVEASSRLLLSSLAASLLVTVFMVGSIIVGLRQWLLAPIDALRRAVNAVAAGRYDTRIPAVGPKEIVALAGNVEAMRALLVQLVRQNERSWEALAQEGPAVVALRDALTPSTLHASGVVLRGRVDPAEGELAGDWFDSFDLPDGRVAVVVGDVSGHGAAAGVFALRLKQLLAAALNSGERPGQAIEWAVDSLGETSEMFATAVVVVIDPPTGTLHYANAGHPEPLLLRRGGTWIPSQTMDGDGSRATAGALAGGREPSSAPGTPARTGGVRAVHASPAGSHVAAVETLGVTGPLVSSLLAEHEAWRTETVRLWPGDVFFAYTDGLVEARNTAGEQFGRHRLEEEILRDSNRRPGDLLDSAFDVVRRYSPGRPEDDRTAIVLARTVPCEPAE